MITPILGTLLTAAVLYMVLSPRYNYALYRPLMFHPYPYEPGMEMPPTYSGCDSSEIFFRGTSGRKLCAWLFKLPDAEQIILFSHGNAGNLSNRNHIVPFLLQTGASVFVYEYAGFGKSEGLPTLEGICEDGLAAFDYVVKELGYDPRKIIVYGESLGASVAMYSSTQRQCGGIILQSGFSSLRQIALEIFPFLKAFPLWMFPRQELNTLVSAQKPHPPMLIIHGKHDEVIPFSHAERLYAGASEPKELLTLPDSGHNDISSTAPQEYVQAIRGLLSRCAAVDANRV